MIRPYLRGFMQALVFYPGRVTSMDNFVIATLMLPWPVVTDEDSPDYARFIQGYAEGMKMVEKQTEGAAYVVAPYERRLESMLADAAARAAAYKAAYEQVKYLAVDLLTEPADLQKVLSIGAGLKAQLPVSIGEQSLLPVAAEG